MAIQDTSTPTIQEILESYQQGVGAGGVNTALLIQALKERQRRAVEEDTQTAKAIGSGGTAFLAGRKHLRDFQIAQRVKPDLSFSEFMRDPATSAKYVKEGTELISSGKRAPIGFGEAFNPWSKKHLSNPYLESLSDLAQKQGAEHTGTQLTQEIEAGRLAEMREALHQKNLQDLAGAQESISGATETALRGQWSGEDVNIPQTNVASTYQSSPSIDPSGISGLSAQDARRKLQEGGYSGDLSSIRSGYSTQPMGDISGLGPKQLLGAGQPSLLGMSSGAGVNIPTPPSALAQSVFQQQQPFNPFRAGPSAFRPPIAQAPLPSLTQGLAPISAGAPEVTGAALPGAYSRLGLGALGKASNVYGVGKGLQEISEGGGDLSTVSGTASSLAALAGLNPLVAGGLGLLSYVSRR